MVLPDHGRVGIGLDLQIDFVLAMVGECFDLSDQTKKAKEDDASFEDGSHQIEPIDHKGPCVG